MARWFSYSDHIFSWIVAVVRIILLWLPLQSLFIKALLYIFLLLLFRDVFWLLLRL